MNIYNNHKVILITDEQSLQKENLTLESFTKEFNINVEKSKQLKEKIEGEITKINNLYENIDTKVTNSYLLKHEKLTKEENDLKEKLQNEVTKVKEKLENFLSISNTLIKISEKIDKGIQLLEKENQKQKNMIKTLSYITKINKTQKDMKNLFSELMRNINISFNEENISIKYDEYYFNGIPKPKDIEINQDYFCSLDLKWKIDNLNISDLDYKDIKYKVEIRKENKKFYKAYEGNNNFCKIENLKSNKNYELRICTLYEDIISSWTEIQKIKKTDYKGDSIILYNSKRGNEFTKKLLEWSGYKKMELLYRGTRDGSLSKNFHEKCDNQGPTVTLCEHEKGYIFGGFCSISWTGQGNYKSSPNSFLFTLTNNFGIGPTKFELKNNNDVKGIYDYIDYGPIFGAGHDLYILNDYFKNKIYSNFPYTYKDNIGKGKLIFSDDGNGYFNVKEIEVFKLT